MFQIIKNAPLDRNLTPRRLEALGGLIPSETIRFLVIEVDPDFPEGEVYSIDDIIEVPRSALFIWFNQMRGVWKKPGYLLWIEATQ